MPTGPRPLTPTRRESAAAPPSTAGAWWMAVRPPTLGASLVPVGVGLSLAGRGGDVNLTIAAATLAAALLLQVAANLANDYYDFAHGVDTGARLGPARVSQAGLLDAAAVKRGMQLVLATALLIGAYLVFVGGRTIAIIGAVSALAALAYSAGPWPLAWYGLGEALAFVFFGPIAVCGTVLLQRQPVGWPALCASIPVACLVTAIMAVNNLRDIPTDSATGKKTFAVRLGASGTRVEYTALLVAAFLMVPVIARLVGAGAWAVLLAVPLAAFEIAALWARDGAELNRSLMGTARLHLAAGTLLILGLLR